MGTYLRACRGIDHGRRVVDDVLIDLLDRTRDGNFDGQRRVGASRTDGFGGTNRLLLFESAILRSDPENFGVEVLLGQVALRAKCSAHSARTS